MSQQEIYDLMNTMEQLSALSSYIVHSTNWLIYALTMKQFRQDLLSLLHQIINHIYVSRHLKPKNMNIDLQEILFRYSIMENCKNT